MREVRILYIEDNDIQRKTLAQGLRSKGYSVSVATSGRTGLRLFKSKSFEVILCDLNMPEMDGLGVLENIRHKNPDIPFIILSAHGTIPLAVKAIKKGANYFVLKPVEINQITIIIEQIIEKAKLQKKLEDSQHTLQMVAENVPDIIYSLNPEGEFISISPSAEIALEYKPTEFIGKSVFKIIHPDDRERVMQSFMQSIKGTGPKVKTIQFRMVSKTGKIKHFEISRTMVVENGQIIRNDGIARDVTHKVELEQKLKEYSQELINANLEMLETQQKLENRNTEMEELLNELSKNKDELQTIIDTNPGIIILADNEGIIKASNNGVFDYFGLLPEKIINIHFDEFIAKIKSDVEDFDTFRNWLDECKEAPYCSGEYDISELYNRGVPVKKHKPGILSPTCCRVQDKDGKNIGHLWIFSDISFLKQADEQVHTIVNASPIPTIISRIEDGKILYVNEELALLVGLTSKELIGKNTPDFYYNKEDRKIVVESLKRDGYLRDFETRIKKEDGTVVWMIFSLVATEMGGEKVLLGWLYDISERKKSEEGVEILNIIFDFCNEVIKPCVNDFIWPKTKIIENSIV